MFLLLQMSVVVVLNMLEFLVFITGHFLVKILCRICLALFQAALEFTLM